MSLPVYWYLLGPAVCPCHQLPVPCPEFTPHVNKHFPGLPRLLFQLATGKDEVLALWLAAMTADCILQ